MSKENWKPGDIAICVKVGSLTSQQYILPPLKLKAEYIVSSVKTCCCGRTSLDVGISRNIERAHYCSGCRRGTLNEPIWWCAAERFVKKKTKEEIKEEIKEEMNQAVVNEDYEKAQELFKLINQ